MAGISLEKIEALAPDQASLVAARKLVKPNGWSGLSSDNSSLIWGECRVPDLHRIASLFPRQMLATNAPARVGNFPANTALR